MAEPTYKTILVTGGCGYLGSQLIRDLATDPLLGSPTVRILDNMQKENYQALMDLPSHGKFQFIEGDILDPAVISLALDSADAVIHLAAIVRTPMSFEHPSWVKQVNHWGTARLVENCLNHGVNRLIFASSSAVYGPGGPFTEAASCHPLGPYAQSKKGAESSVLTAKDRGLITTILRFGTVFGHAPITRFDAVVNRFAYLSGTKKSITIYGRGDQTRPIIHVRDTSAAIRFCLQHTQPTSGKIFNVAAENVTIGEIADAVKSIVTDSSCHYTEQDVLTHLSFATDNEKLLDLGWQPRITLVEGLAELISRFTSLSKATPALDDLDLT